MGQRTTFSAPLGPWYASPSTRRDFQNPVVLGLLHAPPRFLGQAPTTPAAEAAQGNEPFNLPQEVARDWADKIEAYMEQVQAIQDYVRTHPEESASSGLAKDAAGLPPSGDLAAFPYLKAVHGKLRAGAPVTESEMDLIPALGVALIAPNQKLAVLQTSLLTPLNLGIGAGIVALVVGLVVLS